MNQFVNRGTDEAILRRLGKALVEEAGVKYPEHLHNPPIDAPMQGEGLAEYIEKEGAGDPPASDKTEEELLDRVNGK